MTPLSDAERFARLRLARTDRVGPVAFSQLLQRFGSAIRAVDALPDLVRRSGRDGYALPPIERVEAELAAGERVGARLILLGDADYPDLLANVDPPPPLLWTRGDPALLSRPCIGVVGARIASAGGQRIARGLSQQLGEAGHVVVSGLARGIDAAAHLGALPTGTIAVLGGGVDDIYPTENAELYRQIVEQGCIVSESPVGARAQARDFPRRNRIISGLSRGVIVVEAEIRSGSLITARLANEQGRDVFAVPGSPLDPRSKGPNELLRQGAILCEGLEDVERAFTTLRTLREPPSDSPFQGAPDDLDQALIEQIVALLSPTPIPRDELARALDLPIGVVAAALLELNLAGRATLLPGGLASI
ncbi:MULTISPECIES: DNA-processing protein DprA [unclassified Brevundimonas]|uniref:DNA-processing protein DprA n=1 Tax=unclassified Brevundimonas TaxID=2622653 RepID=UPI000CFD41C0|nr:MULTISPECIES: DNA-processing protein DprA [unclassified Brevundimonas]PRA33615.1 DNA-protecting protein DprA [Brevundimonas sp. MYb27]PQZ81831.1 DNA-protecting protein DprA [Brevundimonas sp. MYb31]PRB13317.1 DNA-protecting protein DprA [Brevundimonas sp. MYb52]PRB33966.1 DNA-protecting protein DprA [Brevundimonas sp. MYb46]PRB52654.1 DNA-protecting protein DprA [Brevundimonas sp. MYb33]